MKKQNLSEAQRIATWLKDPSKRYRLLRFARERLAWSLMRAHVEERGAADKARVTRIKKSLSSKK